MDLMIIFYAIIYIIGILLGSFFTLAIYRIPRKQDITHKRSYCPNCNHKLGFFDLIPVLSFICLKGRCRYCKNKIGSRYIKIELISGIVYTLLISILKFNIYDINLFDILKIIFITIVYSIISIIVGIKIENK